jgi:hypothetical protein
MCGIFTLLNNDVFSSHFVNTQFEKGKGRGPETSKLEDVFIKTTFGFHRLAINGLNEESNQPLIIDDIILQHFDITCFDTIMSPFFGGGSFEFYLQNKYGLKLIVNDKFTPLYNFWKQVKVNKTILCEELRKIKSVSKEQFTSYRDTIMDLNDDVLQQSVQYFIINRCSF